MHENTTVTALPPIIVHPDDSEPIGVSVIDAIPGDAVVVSVNDVDVQPSGTMQILGPQPNAAIVYEEPNNKGRAIPIGKAILGVPLGQTTGSDYVVTFTAQVSIAHPDYPSTFTRVFVMEVRCREK